MSTFDYYAAYYDLLYKDKDYAGETDYIISLIKQHLETAKTILDLGCGTGKHDFLLAQKGFQVAGVDSSVNMIAKANAYKETANLSLSFYPGDIRSIRLNRMFDVVVSLFHVINYQISNQDLSQTFATAQTHLHAGGLFIFDSWYGPGVLTDKPERRVKEIADERIAVERLAEPEMHYDQNVVDVNYTLNIKDQIHLNNQAIKEQHRMRYLFYPEVELIAGLHNFEVIGFEKWLTGGLPQNDWFVTFICRLK